MPGIGDKLMTAAEIKAVTNTKADKDFSTLTTLPNGLASTDLFNVRRSNSNYKLSGADISPTPLVLTIPASQWSGSGSDYYISVAASNVTENSILVPSYDRASSSVLKGPIWCISGDGAFTIHTTAIPSDSVTVMVQFPGIMGEADYQVLADVYSTSQVDSAIAQAVSVTRITDSTEIITPASGISVRSASLDIFGSLHILRLDLRSPDTDISGRQLLGTIASQYCRGQVESVCPASQTVNGHMNAFVNCYMSSEGAITTDNFTGTSVREIYIKFVYIK